jgi:hypothetical protein
MSDVEQASAPDELSAKVAAVTRELGHEPRWYWRVNYVERPSERGSPEPPAGLVEGLEFDELEFAKRAPRSGIYRRRLYARGYGSRIVYMTDFAIDKALVVTPESEQSDTTAALRAELAELRRQLDSLSSSRGGEGTEALSTRDIFSALLGALNRPQPSLAEELSKLAALRQVFAGETISAKDLIALVQSRSSVAELAEAARTFGLSPNGRSRSGDGVEWAALLPALIEALRGQPAPPAIVKRLPPVVLGPGQGYYHSPITPGPVNDAAPRPPHTSTSPPVTAPGPVAAPPITSPSPGADPPVAAPGPGTALPVTSSTHADMVNMVKPIIPAIAQWDRVGAPPDGIADFFCDLIESTGLGETIASLGVDGLSALVMAAAESQGVTLRAERVRAIVEAVVANFADDSDKCM